MRTACISRHLAVVIVPLMTLLMACSGNNSQTTIDSSSSKHNAKSLASIKSGGATDLYLDNGRIFFSDYNRGVIYSVPTSGGEIISHYLNGFLSPWRVVTGGNKIYILNSITDIGGIVSVPDTAIGITPLDWENLIARDVATDNTYVYWASGAQIFRTPLILTGDSGVECIFNGTAGSNRVRFALDGENLFASEDTTRNIYRINLTTGISTMIVSGLGSAAIDFTWGGMTLAVTSPFLYAMDGKNDIYSIDKQTGSYTKIASTYLSADITDKIRSATDMLYWWESDATSLYLKRLNSLSGQIDIIATIPFTWYFIAFYPDGTSVYWFTYDYNSTGNQIIYVWRMPAAGGTIENIASFDGYLGTNLGMAPGFLTGDVENLYWTSTSINALFKMPKSGGSPTIVTREVGYATPKVAVAGSYIYLGDNEGIKKVPIMGQTEPTAEWVSSTPPDIARDDLNLYWISPVASPTDGFDLYSMPLSSGSAQKLATLSGYGTRIFPYNDSLYFIKLIAGGSEITRISKTGNQEEILLVINGGEPVDIFITNNKLYFTLGGIYRIDLDTLQLSTLLESRPNANQLYVDTSYVYFTEFIPNSAYGGVYRLPLAGGAPETLYSGQWSWKIVGDADNIYWAAGWNIFKMEK